MKNMINKNAFSLIELSIVILIIGILVAGVTQSSRLIRQMKISSARSITNSSPISSISNLSGWWETTLETSLDQNLSNNDKILSWNDINPQSLYKINFTQGNATYQPQFVESGINGIPSLSFNNSFLTLTNFTLSGNYTFFIVFNSTSISSNGSSIISLTESSLHGINFAILSATGAYLGLNRRFRALHRSPLGSATENDNYINASNTIADNKDYILSYSRNLNTNQSDFYLNGISANDATYKGATAQALNSANLTLMIGNLMPSNLGRPFNGKISEIIIFDKALNSEEMKAVNDYLSKKYNIK